MSPGSFKNLPTDKSPAVEILIIISYGDPIVLSSMTIVMTTEAILTVDVLPRNQVLIYFGPS